jgi:hypothetical protein
VSRALLGYLCDFALAAVIATCLWLFLWLSLGCAAIESAGGEVAEFIACPTDLIDCGHVYECEQAADNELKHVEICIDDDDHPEDLDAAEVVYGACWPTPRHQGLCLFCCGPTCGRGANAFNGTFCEGHE